jgi:hypothetical protein
MLLPSSLSCRAAVLAASTLLAGCATTRTFSGDIVTDRPDFTESPVAVPTRSVQLEMGDTYERSGGVRLNTIGEALVRVGVARGAELRFGLPSYVRVEGPASIAGASDANVGAKVELVNGARAAGLVPTTALIVGAGLPTGARAFRAGGVSPEAKLLMGWSLGGPWALASNINVASVDAGDTRSGELAGSVSLARSLTERTGAYLEWFGTRPEGVRGTHYANGGMTYLITGSQQLDVRVGSGLGANRNDFFVGLGLSQRW